jgi:hypothetical protein
VKIARRNKSLFVENWMPASVSFDPRLPGFTLGGVFASRAIIRYHHESLGRLSLILYLLISPLAKTVEKTVIDAK